MIRSSKNNRENYPRKCFRIPEKETWVKFNPRLSANRPSNNWAQTVNLTNISLTDSKNLYYCSTKSKSEQSYAFSEQIYAFLFYNLFQHEKPFCFITMMVRQCCYQIYSINSMFNWSFRNKDKSNCDITS